MIVKIETSQEMQLDIAIASVYFKNIMVTSTIISLDDPCINIAIKLSLLSITVFHEVTIEDKLRWINYTTASVNCNLQKSRCPKIFNTLDNLRRAHFQGFEGKRPK